MTAMTPTTTMMTMMMMMMMTTTTMMMMTITMTMTMMMMMTTEGQHNSWKKNIDLNRISKNNPPSLNFEARPLTPKLMNYRSILETFVNHFHPHSILVEKIFGKICLCLKTQFSFQFQRSVCASVIIRA